MSKNICQFCGTEFTAARSDKKYCSYSCQNKARYEDAICLNCGKIFRKCGKNVKCCSPTCAKEYEWKNKLPVGVSVVESSKQFQCRFVEAACKTCGKIIKIRHGDYNRQMKTQGFVTCSRACNAKAKGISVKLTCFECGKEFYRKQSQVDPNNKHFFCSKKCQKKNIDYILRGSDHFRYIDGKSSCKRGKGWVQTRKEIRERDNYTCQQCGKTEREIGKALDVHHIKPYRLFDNYGDANKSENLISLCPSCHHKADAELASKLRDQI